MSVGRLLRHRSIFHSQSEEKDLLHFGKHATVDELRKVIDVLYYPNIFQAGDKGAYQFEADRVLANRFQQNIDLSRNDLISEFVSYTYSRLNKHVTSTLVKRLPKSVKEELQKDFGHREYITETNFRTNNTFT